MIATMGATPVALFAPGKRQTTAVMARWIGPAPVELLPRTRVRLAEGIWVVPRHSRGLNRPEWMGRGLCAQLAPAVSDPLFFGVERREAPGTLIAAANVARQICGRCPVELTCLTHALVTGERYGVWGGTSGRQRTKLRNRLDRGAGVDELVAECLPALTA